MQLTSCTLQVHFKQLVAGETFVPTPVNQSPSDVFFPTLMLLDTRLNMSS